MDRPAISDTGPLVAYFDRSERHHDWSVSQFNTLRSPLLINEPVLTEALFLLRRDPSAIDAMMTLLERGILRIDFSVADHVANISALMRQYRDTPMSLADACIVRMGEVFPEHAILTLDSDFFVYRKFRRDSLLLITPDR